ncbi:hypothetical protein [Flavobacterium gilvum]|uniref:T9SS C-terminal target domain-containing protein n=1 Tax=Flavobacterium gilvum TaxID=1492737 RepID=A0AAC9N4W7_9FLAO|nr:hypothetical protein [Flavobacterium gilvum]AOW08861.1 hypothetical protein EM308_04715 [Flavobacterium gilvum]KFC60067.1 hypothetical protein FEM08_11410 [Flavobacterium gilvum]
MKNILLIICVFLTTVCSVNAQQEKGIIGSSNWLNNWTEFKPSKVDYGEPTQILAGNITQNTKLVKKEVYILQGNVYVTNNAVLTIEPGTVIIGDGDSKGTLVITKGAQIIAEGMETDPIVFTSNKSIKKAGDWGGVIILGDAPINKFGSYSSVNYDLDPSLTTYGGQNPASSSGVLKFVRIEFAGKKVRGSSEGFNALLLGGIGNKTILENIMVSYAAGDSFEVLGGEPIMSKMISYKSNGIDYKFTFGAQAKIDNSLAVRSSYLTASSGSRCLDVSSYSKKEEVDFTKKQTLVTATNLTFANDSDHIDEDIKAGLVKEGLFVGENSSLVLRKSVISGFSPAVVLDRNIEINNKNLKKIRIEEMYLNFCNGNIFSEGSTENEDLESYYGDSAFFNLYSKTTNLETFNDFANPRRPDFRLALSKFTAAAK